MIEDAIHAFNEEEISKRIDGLPDFIYIAPLMRHIWKGLSTPKQYRLWWIQTMSDPERRSTFFIQFLEEETIVKETGYWKKKKVEEKQFSNRGEKITCSVNIPMINVRHPEYQDMNMICYYNWYSKHKVIIDLFKEELLKFNINLKVECY